VICDIRYFTEVRRIISQIAHYYPSGWGTVRKGKFSYIFYLW